MKGPQTKAKAIDLKKEQIVKAGLALLLVLGAIALISSSAKASSGAIESNGWSAHSQVESGTGLLFELKSQKLNH
ncbi:MAG: hypothetical protein K2Q18_09620 [Bdellovibrionales bacterium]|nr:hypothetical protein [Bdellovibrionales bacterium]